VFSDTFCHVSVLMATMKYGTSPTCWYTPTGKCCGFRQPYIR